MIGTQRSLVAASLIGLDGFEHVDVPFVRKHFLEVEVAAANVAKVNHEYPARRREFLDDRDHVVARLREHLGDRALAEIESVVAARTQ